MYTLLICFHLLGATVWTGGHLILCCCILPHALKHRDTQFISQFESLYERLGIPALITQVVTGLMLIEIYWPQNLELFSVENSIQKLLWIKLGLLGLTVLFAVDARLRIIPQLDETKIVSLAIHIIPVTMISILFVMTGLGFRLGWFS